MIKENGFPKKNQQINQNIIIKFGFRGENIEYQDNEKSVEIAFTWMNGPRLVTDTIEKWKDGSEISDKEKENIFRNTLLFISSRFPKSIIKISRDDKSGNIWEESCRSMSSLIENIEYSSDEERYQNMKNHYLETLKRTNIMINGQLIEDEKQLDIALEKFAKKHRKS